VDAEHIPGTSLLSCQIKSHVTDYIKGKNGWGPGRNFDDLFKEIALKISDHLWQIKTVSISSEPCIKKKGC
jgi:hypothetical protein